jgi:hypothetical protein
MKIQIVSSMNIMSFTLPTLLTIIVGTASAQQLPPPSRTVFKCNVAGKAVYSDSPCLGAERLEVDPTRGLDAASGRKVVGSDVTRERHREQVAEMMRPITGMDAKQLDAYGRRMKLSQATQRECLNLDKALPLAEKEEGETAGVARTTVQERLYGLRKRFRELGC